MGASCLLVNGRAFKPEEWSADSTGLKIVRIQNLRDPRAPYNFFKGEAEVRHLVEEGDVLFSWSGTPETSFGAHIWVGPRAILNQHIFKVVFDPAFLHPEYLKLALNAEVPALIPYAKGGAGLKHLNKGQVESIRLPVPPRLEQDRIVAKLHATALKIGGFIDELDRIGSLIPNLEQRCFAIAAAGRDPASGSNRETLFAAKLRDLGEITLGLGRNPSRHSGPSMRPYLRVANVLEDKIDITDVMQMNFSDTEFQRYKLATGDILLNEGQSLSLVGRPALFRNEIEDCCFTNTLIRFRSGKGIIPEYAMYVFRHFLHSGRFSQIAKITTNLAHLGASRFADMTISVPSVETQKKIVKFVASVLTRLDVVGEGLTKASSLMSDFKHLLERSALTGKLGTQEASEPAPILRAPIPIARKAASVNDKSRVGARKRTGMSKQITAVDALRQAKRPMTARELFDALGYVESASVGEVEQFFIHLRSSILTTSVRRDVVDGEPQFSLDESVEL